MHAAPMPVCGRYAETAQAPAGITDVLTIGEEATVLRPVRRAIRPTCWAIAHAPDLEAALGYLRSNIAAVAVIEAEISERERTAAVSRLRNLARAPEVVVLTSQQLAMADVLRCGAFDLLRRPFDDCDLLWALASAWHTWMTGRERQSGGGPCSDA
jgi:ActR/RegA family two-component response regulator